MQFILSEPYYPRRRLLVDDRKVLVGDLEAAPSLLARLEVACLEFLQLRRRLTGPARPG